MRTTDLPLDAALEFEGTRTHPNQPNLQIDLGKSRQVEITLLLKDGHLRSVDLGASDPALYSLLETLAAKEAPLRPATLFNLQTRDGGSLLFSAADLIAIETKPALAIDLRVTDSVVTFPTVVKPNYFGREMSATFLKFAVENASDFERSQVSSGSRKARRSRVIPLSSDLDTTVASRIRSDMPSVIKRLSIPEFPIGEIECQVTCSSDGSFFRAHTDARRRETSRLVTFVYYFFKEPRAFEGGALRFYQGVLKEGRYTCGKAVSDFCPVNDTVVFFPSSCYHEVLPVRVPSNNFGDSRFTVNGCVHRA